MNITRDLSPEFRPDEGDNRIAEGLEDWDAKGGLDEVEFFRLMSAHWDAVPIAYWEIGGINSLSSWQRRQSPAS